MIGFQNVRAYVPDKGIVRTDVLFENGIITHVGAPTQEAIATYGDDLIVLPGFIDEHIHGAGGADAMDDAPDALATIASTVAEEGTTSFLATTMTQSKEAIQAALSSARDYMAKPALGARLIGVHLEGPFIAPKFKGAQPLSHIQVPSVDLFEEYQSFAGGNIRLVSIAPEEDGALDLVAHLAKTGVRASVGHSAAGYEDVMRAVEAGLSSVTHTYNAQSPVHHREIGVVGTAMLCDALYTELICDTIHVSVPAIQLMIRNKPHDKVILITDSMRAKGLADGVSELGGQTVYVKNGEARLADGTLAGSVLRMNDAIRNLVTKANISLEDAVDFATINPARHLGIDRECGSIAVGKRADFTVLDRDFRVVATYVGGELVYKRV